MTLATLLPADVNGRYSDRVCPPAKTLERLRPFLASLGITRIARQTGLDRLGIPCFASFRPNSLTLSTNQGKGLSDDAAAASAMMEAVEQAVAENPSFKPFVSSAAALVENGDLVFSPERFLPAGHRFNANVPLKWVRGKGLWTGELWHVPFDLVSLNGKADQLKGICQTTNGLASGNTRNEAIFHGLCELVERHANTMWYCLPEVARLQTIVESRAFDDPAITAMAQRIEDAGFQLRLFNHTLDTDVPVMMAVIGEFRAQDGCYDVAAGYGAHPRAERAAIRAITEAAQSRVTSIAAARDDIDPESYGDRIPEEIRRLFFARGAIMPPPKSLWSGCSLDELIGALQGSLEKAGLREPVVVDFPTGLPCRVVRILSHDLEDFEANINWRPGPRARQSMVA